MRNLGLFIAFMSLFGGGAQAQQLLVRSGDHPTFSRLTIPVPVKQPWEARQTTTGVEIQLPDFKGGFDLKDVFIRMQRERIAAIETSRNSLKLVVTCACQATVFRSGSLLVVDVADQGSKLAGPLLDGPPLIGARVTSETQMSNSENGAVLPWIGARSRFAFPLTPPNSAQLNIRNFEPESSSADQKDLLNKVQNELVKEVANAASIGILENSYETPPVSPITDQTGPMTADLTPNALPQLVQVPSENMRISSSMDRDTRAVSEEVSVTASSQTCPSDEFLPVETWGTDQSFSKQIGPARNALIDARDRLDLEAVHHFARLYIHFGFGAEALKVLKLDPTAQTTVAELFVVAAILEHGAATGSNTLAGYASCKSNVALWAILSARDLPSDIAIEANAALRALNKLPQHLRKVVAPMLSDRFLQTNNPNAAATALRSIERLAGEVPPDALMAKADIALGAGISAETALEAIIDSNSMQSARALIKQVEGKIARDEPVSAEAVTLIEAYAQELRGAPIGQKMRRTQIIALGQSQRFDEAFSELGDLKPSLSPEVVKDILQTVLGQLARKADPLSFMEHFLAQNQDDLNNLDFDTKLLLADGLSNLGFFEQAQGMIAMIPATPRIPARQLQAARVAIELRQPFQAQAALIGIEGQKAELLLAQAKEMTGAYSEAADIFTRNDETERAAQAAWLSEHWEEITSADNAEFGAITTLVQRKQSGANAGLGPLGRASHALKESSNARSTIEQLLKEPSLQFEPKLQ
ncbi:hypothetical protein OS189_05425 [Sulfitobacter sp. F26169L]|uniref:hypothetical protein n=1 Tax=Sulfitobacter sp. F26169L TaxID=2996015 RepID=UPI002260EDCF|nr:hypothetical protein [Sulfitobacter sp. F26169L]MCX7565775.1 hypothetical protein [Sulfitobacter sp. F26169L]